MKVLKYGVGFGVSAVIFDSKGSRILLVQRNDNKKWTLPGGSVEDGETPEVAAIREAEEETGLKIKIVCFTGIYIRTKWRHNLLYVYKSVVKEGKLKISNETDSFRWVKPVNVLRITGDKNVAQRVMDTVGYSGSVSLRVQNWTSIKQILIWKKKDFIQKLTWIAKPR